LFFHKFGFVLPVHLSGDSFISVAPVMALGHRPSLSMNIFYELVYRHPWLSLIQGAFTIWMLVDCYRRQAETFWFWVIFFIPGLGAWAYFFAVKIGDFRGVNLSFLQRQASLEELRYRAEQVPTLANHLAFAERLIEKHDYAAALPQLEAAQKKEADHGQVLYLTALCHARAGRPEQALPFLEKLNQRDPRWSGYKSWLLLVETHALSGNQPAALESCRHLVKLSPTLQHKCLLAEHLAQDGCADEARRLLEGALQDHHFAAGPIRRRNRRWASEARQLLKRI
jgi:hypothetical protein